MLTSIGAPSKLVKVPEQKRSPAFGAPCTVQAISPPAPLGTLGIAACAAGATASAAAIAVVAHSARVVIRDLTAPPLSFALSDVRTPG